MLMYKILLRFPKLFKYIHQISFLNSLGYNEFRDYLGFVELIDEIYNYSNIDDKYFVNVLIKARKERNFDCAYRFKNICNLLSKYPDDFTLNNEGTSDRFLFDMITICKYLDEDTRLKLILKLLKRVDFREEIMEYYFNRVFNNLSEENRLKIKTIKDLMRA